MRERREREPVSTFNCSSRRCLRSFREEGRRWVRGRQNGNGEREGLRREGRGGKRKVKTRHKKEVEAGKLRKARKKVKMSKWLRRKGDKKA